jgi:hypothetical protein
LLIYFLEKNSSYIDQLRELSIRSNEEFQRKFISDLRAPQQNYTQEQNIDLEK